MTQNNINEKKDDSRFIESMLIEIPVHDKKITITKGGSGSGDFGHAGRPGLVGGQT